MKEYPVRTTSEGRQGRPDSRPHWAVLSFVDLMEPGAERTHVLEFSRALTRCADVTVVNPTPESEVCADRFDYLRVPCPPVRRPARLQDFLSASTAAATCLRGLNRRRPIDIVYIRDHYAALGVLLWARRVRIRTVLEVNGLVREERLLNAPVSRSWRAPVLRLRLLARMAMLGWGYRLAVKVVTVTESLRKNLVSEYRMPSGKIGVFANGANVQLFVPLEPAACKSRLGFAHPKRYIGFVGNMFKWHGLDALLQAFAPLAAERSDCHLLLVGDGTETQHLTNLTKSLALTSRVCFVGRVPYQDVVHYINACEFCVGPFNGQTRNLACGASPLKVFEYLACGKPVLASDLEDMKFIAEHDVGLLYPADDIDALAAGLRLMLSLTRSEMNAMGARARHLAVEQLSWDSTAAGIFKFVSKDSQLGNHA